MNEGSVQPSRQSSQIVYKVTEAELGGWIDYVNRNWKLKGFLTEIQFLMVKEVGFPFRHGLDEGWELGFERIVEFKDKHGHYNVTRRDCELGLGGFVSR